MTGSWPHSNANFLYDLSMLIWCLSKAMLVCHCPSNRWKPNFLYRQKYIFSFLLTHLFYPNKTVYPVGSSHTTNARLDLINLQNISWFLQRFHMFSRQFHQKCKAPPLFLDIGYCNGQYKHLSYRRKSERAIPSCQTDHLPKLRDGEPICENVLLFCLHSGGGKKKIFLLCQ